MGEAASPGDPKESKSLRIAKNPSNNFGVVPAQDTEVQKSVAASVWRGSTLKP